MKKLARIFVGVIPIVFLGLATPTVGSERVLRKMRGQIIAYRPAERLLHMSSHILNKESFLFRMSFSQSNSQPVVVKLVYEHFGYSDLGDDVLRKTPTLQISVHRDPTCDETYGAFVDSGPTLKADETKGDASAKMIFIEPFQNMKLSAEQPLECYRLQSGGPSNRVSNAAALGVLFKHRRRSGLRLCDLMLIAYQTRVSISNKKPEYRQNSA